MHNSTHPRAHSRAQRQQNGVSTASTRCVRARDYCTVALPSCVFSVRASCSLVLHVAACCIYVALQYARFAVHGKRVQTNDQGLDGIRSGMSSGLRREETERVFARQRPLVEVGGDHPRIQATGCGLQVGLEYGLRGRRSLGLELRGVGPANPHDGERERDNERRAPAMRSHRRTARGRESEDDQHRD